MRKSVSDNFIRGGQTTQHWLRMAAQVIKSAISFAALFFFIAYVGLCFTYYKVENIHLTWANWLASFFVENRGQPDKLIRYKDPENGWVEDTAAAIYQNQFIQDISEQYLAKAYEFAYWSFIPAGFAALIAGIVFYISGSKLDGDEHIRGTKLVTAKELKRWVDFKWKAYKKQFGKDFKKGPEYTIAGIRFPPNAVEAQTAICGTVGTGKTTCLKELLNVIRDNDGRAIIYDRMGALVRDYYDPETDIIINPFDDRSHAWSPFYEAERPEFFTQIAEVMIPDRPGSNDPFWTQAARIVFDYAAQKLLASGDYSNAKLRDAILLIPGEELAAMIENTPGRHFLNQEIAKTAGSIRANLIAELRFLEFLHDDGEPFSIRDWVKTAKNGFVFLTGDSEHAAATRNIISTIFEVGANALMTCEESNDPKIWFLMDEVPTLNRMPFLDRSLAEIRQFGGAFVVGYQVYSQLEDIYGEKSAQTIVGNLNNRIIFNTPDARTAELFSKSLGSEDVDERRENISVGAHETRDGVSFMSQRTERPIVTASQIQSLPQFQGYVRFAYDAPAAFIKFKPVNREVMAPKFIPYHGGKFAKGSMNAATEKEIIEEGGKPAPSSFNGLTKEQQKAEFEEWRSRIVNSGMEIFAPGQGMDTVLWDHFSEKRKLGQRANEIGPPAPSVPMMGSNENETQILPLVNSDKPHGKSELSENVEENGSCDKAENISENDDTDANEKSGRRKRALIRSAPVEEIHKAKTAWSKTTEIMDIVGDQAQ
ncbi:MAG: type IV secretion system DNA-binding domain-containing protein [Rhodobacteraceae bacterium]|nr:type IV secretion system DNA-binding domain-containing protein [Paracoccaceae bacterium]